MANSRKYPVPELGQRFGKWTVIDNKLHRCPTIKQKVKGVVLKCDCGNTTILPPSYLYRRVSTQCQDCKGNYISTLKFNGVGELSSTYYTQLKRNAKRRNIEFDVTIEYLWNLFLQQEGKCALSNTELTLTKSYANKIRKEKKGYAIYETASVDRIDSHKGYIEGNVQWVHKKVNMMKNDLNQTEFIDLCKKISAGTNTKPKIEIIARMKVEGIHRWKKVI